MFLRVIVIWYNVGFMEKTKSFTPAQANYVSCVAGAGSIKPSLPGYSSQTNGCVRFQEAKTRITVVFTAYYFFPPK